MQLPGCKNRIEFLPATSHSVVFYPRQIKWANFIIIIIIVTIIFLILGWQENLQMIWTTVLVSWNITDSFFCSWHTTVASMNKCLKFLSGASDTMADQTSGIVWTAGNDVK